MATLQKTIMSDNSRLFACIENKSLSQNLIKRIPSRETVRLSESALKKYVWADFNYRDENISVFSGTGDLMLFVENQNCSERILKELVEVFLD
ncbi:MAG: hypothetical protein R2764_03705 [Bacteroidales bacterium]